jgi:hypothetical protein
MEGMWEAAIVAGMFVLRLGVPLAITVAVGYLLHRLDAKWQAEAWTQWETSQMQRTTAGAMSPVAKQSCWTLKGCGEAARDRCPAFKRPNIPCWLARRRVEGRLPATCYDCELFSLKQVAQSMAS